MPGRYSGAPAAAIAEGAFFGLQRRRLSRDFNSLFFARGLKHDLFETLSVYINGHALHFDGLKAIVGNLEAVVATVDRREDRITVRTRALRRGCFRISIDELYRRRRNDRTARIRDQNFQFSSVGLGIKPGSKHP